MIGPDLPLGERPGHYLVDGPFSVLVADPAWRFKDSLSKRRGASRQYPTMTLKQMKDLPLPPMLDDSVLFMWRVAAMLQDALDLMRAWDYAQKSELVWVKLSAAKHRGQLLLNDDDDPWLSRSMRMGMGRIVRHAHEVCLIGTRGKPKRLTAGIRSVFSAPAGKHSEKPVQRLYAGPYVEMFSRQERKGWTCYGNQLPERREK